MKNGSLKAKSRAMATAIWRTVVIFAERPGFNLRIVGQDIDDRPHPKNDDKVARYDGYETPQKRNPIQSS